MKLAKIVPAFFNEHIMMAIIQEYETRAVGEWWNYRQIQQIHLNINMMPK
jgi:hypothetical protein